MSRNPLKGSERTPLPGAQSIGKADPTERLEVTVLLRRRDHDALKAGVRKLVTGHKPDSHLRRTDFAKHYGADSGDIATVKKFAHNHGLTVVQEHEGRRTLVLSGTVAQFNEAFGVELQQFEHPGGTYRGRTGPVHLPDELNGIVEAVLGLDNRPQAKPHFRQRLKPGNVNWHGSAAALTAFMPTSLSRLYNFPPESGRGECIGIIELGGGYRTADLKAYFAELDMSPPKVTAVSVDHARNHPTGDANGPDGEVMLDIEIAGAIAPRAHIVVYFAPNTDAGFIDAITTAVHDTTNKPSVLSISWGGPESSWTPQAMMALDEAFQAAAAMGITVCVASGDDGSSDGVNDGANHVDFPASSPYALACGGTRLQASDGKIASETVWNDGVHGGATGGGVSRFFELPPWQKGLKVFNKRKASPLKMRGVPDVSGNGDPDTGYKIRVDGTDAIIGGTSAVAPLWAGLIARINSITGTPIGYINPRLYKHGKALHDIQQGNNGHYSAGPHWDACSGLGSPNGMKLKSALARNTP